MVDVARASAQHREGTCVKQNADAYRYAHHHRYHAACLHSPQVGATDLFQTRELLGEALRCVFCWPGHEAPSCFSHIRPVHDRAHTNFAGHDDGETHLRHDITFQGRGKRSRGKRMSVDGGLYDGKPTFDEGRGILKRTGQNRLRLTHFCQFMASLIVEVHHQRRLPQCVPDRPAVM